MAKRLGIFVTHPIQYFAPLWRRLAATPGLSLCVHFFSDHSARGGPDPGFKVPVAWDTPLLEGYGHRFLRRDADLSRPLSVSLPNARALLREEQLDWVMIHGYTHRFEVQVVRAARALGIPVVQRGEFSDRRPGGRRLFRLLRGPYLRWFYSRVSRFCYVGEQGRQHLLRHGVSEDRVFFSPYSVDSDFFERQRERLGREECRQELGVHPGDMVVLFSGKLIPRKNPLLLIEAVKRLPFRDRLVLVILGDGELRGAVQAQAASALRGRAILPGFVNQTRLGRYFRAADVFVLPSAYETWGLVVNEAMHFGLPPVVSSGVGCLPDLIRPGQTGEVFPAGSVEGLADRLGELCRSPERRTQMGEAARQHIRAYSTAASVDGILRALGVPAGEEGTGPEGDPPAEEPGRRAAGARA